jgi:hypothetical protein
MVSKLILVAASAAMSLDATAGYIQYDFSGPISGFVVQHDDDHSLAYYNFTAPLTGSHISYDALQDWFAGGLALDGGNLSNDVVVNHQFVPVEDDFYNGAFGGTTHFANGPTNLHGSGYLGRGTDLQLDIDFQRASNGAFSYIGTYSAYFPTSNDWFYGTGTLSGKVTQGTVDHRLAQALDDLGGYDRGVMPFPPAYIGGDITPANDTPVPGGALDAGVVPEPGSMVLLVLGFFGMLAAGRVSRAVRHG